MSEPTRKGKIARLPAAIREEVNLRLHDGQPASKILAWLNTQEVVLRVLDELFNEEPVSPQNLSEWKGGGYLDWLRRREKVENMRQLSQYAYSMAQAGGSVSEGAAAIAGGKILEFLEDADDETIEGLALALAKLRDSEARNLAAKTAHANLQRKDRQLDLDERKYQRSTAELFIKWAQNEEVRMILNGNESKAVKMDKLVQAIFGERPT